METLLHILFIAPPLLIAIVLHEVAHGFVAYRLGDPTAKSLGRLSLNPLKHIDLFMTVILPGLLILSGSPVVFGGAKPVPVNAGYFQSPRRGMMWVALAGPVTNFILLGICAAMLQLLALWHPTRWEGLLVFTLFQNWLIFGVLTNLVLAIFNLFPVPPLDGGRIAVGLLPRNLAIMLAKLEPYGLFIIFGLLYFRVIDKVLGPATEYVLRMVL